MPAGNTITTFFDFVQGTKANATEVNTNFQNFRGNILPTRTDTAAASDLTHNLGSDEHRWNAGYFGSVDLETSTSTASLVIEGDTSNTTGAMSFKIGGVEKFNIDADGFDGNQIRSGTGLRWLNFEVVGATTVEAVFSSETSFCYVEAVSGGGGGGGSNQSVQDGAGGGGSGQHFNGFFKIIGGQTYTLTVGGGGSGGVGGSNGSPGNAGGPTSFSTLLSLTGGNGGQSGGGGPHDGGAQLSQTQLEFQTWSYRGGTSPALGNGSPGQSSRFFAGGIGGSLRSGSTSAGGGGAASYYGPGGNGGFSGNTGQATSGFSPTSTAYGAGGGGAGATDDGVAFRNGGAGAAGFMRVTYLANNTATVS